MKSSELLLAAYLKFQEDHGKLISLRDFAKHLGVHISTVSLILNGKREPSRDTVEKLAENTGDMRFYDAAGLARPDKTLQYITSEWGNLTAEQHLLIREQVAKYSMSNKDDDQSVQSV